MDAGDEHHGGIMVVLAVVGGGESKLSDAVTYMLRGGCECCEAQVDHLLVVVLKNSITTEAQQSTCLSCTNLLASFMPNEC